MNKQHLIPAEDEVNFGSHALMQTMSPEQEAERIVAWRRRVEQVQRDTGLTYWQLALSPWVAATPVCDTRMNIREICAMLHRNVDGPDCDVNKV